MATKSKNGRLAAVNQELTDFRVTGKGRAPKVELTTKPAPKSRAEGDAEMAKAAGVKAGTLKEIERIVLPTPQIEVFEVDIVGVSSLIIHAWSAKAIRQMMHGQKIPGGGVKPGREAKIPVNRF